MGLVQVQPPEHVGALLMFSQAGLHVDELCFPFSQPLADAECLGLRSFLYSSQAPLPSLCLSEVTFIETLLSSAL